MRIAVILLLCIILCLLTEFSSAWWRRRRRRRRRGNTNIDKNGVNYRSNNGRHNVNINNRNARYNYAGNRWNTNVNHHFRNGQTNVNANYRRNHNFRVGHNWRNRQTNFGYTWNFGKRRRGLGMVQDEMLEFLKMESQPRDFLLKLKSAVDMFIKTFGTTVPELQALSFPPPDDKVTNVTAAEEIVCIVMKLQNILPKSLGNFTVKMIKFHGPSFDIKGLEDFFSVDPVDELNTAVNQNKDIDCEIPNAPTSNELVVSGKLVEIKKFVATLITVGMEYQQMLEG